MFDRFASCYLLCPLILPQCGQVTVQSFMFLLQCAHFSMFNSFVISTISCVNYLAEKLKEPSYQSTFLISPCLTSLLQALTVAGLPPCLCLSLRNMPSMPYMYIELCFLALVSISSISIFILLLPICLISCCGNSGLNYLLLFILS